MSEQIQAGNGTYEYKEVEVQKGWFVTAHKAVRYIALNKEQQSTDDVT